MESPRSTCWPYAGARWWKFDFHAHTPASKDYGAGPDQGSLTIIEPRDWLKGFNARWCGLRSRHGPQFGRVD